VDFISISNNARITPPSDPYDIYYGMADSRIGVARFDLPASEEKQRH
jgi:hypothetical protein